MSEATILAKIILKLQGINAELMPNQVDRDFSGASAWANSDIDAYNETGDLTITANAAAQYCTCPVLSMPTTVGETYLLKFDVANLISTWTIKSFDGTQTIGTVSVAGLQKEFSFVAATTGGLRLVAVANDSSGDFDNFSLVRSPLIGAVHDYERHSRAIAEWILLMTSGGKINGWTAHRESTPVDEDTIATLRLNHTFRLKGYYSVDDAAASGKTFQALVELVRKAFKNDKTLGGTAINSYPVQVELVAIRELMPESNYFVHYAELSLQVEEREWL